jgi:adenylylsulfate kinase
LKYNLFIGRWAPFHNGHKYIIDSFVNNNKPVCIGIRDTELDPKNPLSAENRRKLIEKVYEDNELVKVITIPDIDTVAVGRGVGYSILGVPEEISAISATKVRAGEKQDLPEEIKQMATGGHVIWFTGLPCSGKTTVADKVAEMISREDRLVERLDGDIVRKSICKDLGFSHEDRKENLRRVAEVAKVMADNGAIVLATFVSPYDEVRNMVKEIIGPNRFTLVYVYCPDYICESRDVKGMWAKARAGEIKDFTGIDDVFEEPDADWSIYTQNESEETSASIIIDNMYKNKIL